MITPENSRPDFDLLAKYFAGETTHAEAEEVEEWLAASDENMAEFERLSAIWDGDGKPTPTFNADEAWKKVDGQLSVETPAEKSGVMKYLLPIAAMIAGVIIIIGAYRTMMTGDEVKMLVAETQSEPMELALSDGSVVFLNTNSKLEYPAQFSEEGRNVSLSGEAFFEVKRDTTKQFRISAEGSLVTVLGTSFSVKTTDETVEVVVSTGRVAVEDQMQPGPKLELTAGEKGIYLKAERNVAPSFDVETDHLFWKDRTLRYDATPLAEVIEQINRNYDAEVLLADSAIRACPLSTTFQNMELNEILTVIGSTFKLEIDTVSNQILLHGEGCK